MAVRHKVGVRVIVYDPVNNMKLWEKKITGEATKVLWIGARA
jgi:hypothetical protein